MKVKLKIKSLTPEEALARQQATSEKMRNIVRRAVEQANQNVPVFRGKQLDGEAGTPLTVHVPEAMKVHITQLAQLEQRSISSVCKELLEVALGLVMTPEEAAAEAASDAIIQRGQAQGATSAEIAEATLEGIKRSTGIPRDSDFPPMPTQEDINLGKYDPWKKEWNPNWDWKNRRWLR